MLYKRGQVWWFRFRFQGRLIRESTHSKNRNIAIAAERARRRRLEESRAGIARREKPVLFAVAAERWLAGKVALTRLGRAYYAQYVRKLTREFGHLLAPDIDAGAIAALQHKRQAEGLSGRQINCEVATLRAILKDAGLWAAIAPRVKMLRERTDTGRAFSLEDEQRLLAAAAQSPSPSLYPFLLFSLDAGLRPAETRALRHSNLRLVWRNGIVEGGDVVVGASKTEAGSGRVVPLTRRLCGALTLWLSRFPDAPADAYLFPFHRIGFAGHARAPHVWAVDFGRPMGAYSHKRAFDSVRRRTGLSYRLYDARHTFVTRLAENPAVSEETIRQLAGHVSPRMLARYSHIRADARRAAIAALEAGTKTALADREGAQFGAQSLSETGERCFAKPEKALN
jgi:integrase